MTRAGLLTVAIAGATALLGCDRASSNEGSAGASTASATDRVEVYLSPT